MFILRKGCLAGAAATLVLTALPHIADARGGGGHGGMVHPLMPHGSQPATSPPSKQLSQPAPSQSVSQAQAAAAASVAVLPQAPSVPSTALPPSAIAAPARQEATIAPLSPVPAQIIDSSGGAVTTPTASATTTTAANASPSESAPSTPGGGGDTLQACMGFWDRGTHMTKVEWRAACSRTLNRLDLHTPVP
jgi:hypothetical protein